jgi:hypothetical protein
MCRSQRVCLNLCQRDLDAESGHCRRRGDRDLGIRRHAPVVRRAGLIEVPPVSGLWPADVASGHNRKGCPPGGPDLNWIVSPGIEAKGSSRCPPASSGPGRSRTPPGGPEMPAELRRQPHRYIHIRQCCGPAGAVTEPWPKQCFRCSPRWPWPPATPPVRAVALEYPQIASGRPLSCGDVQEVSLCTPLVQRVTGPCRGNSHTVVGPGAVGLRERPAGTECTPPCRPTDARTVVGPSASSVRPVRVHLSGLVRLALPRRHIGLTVRPHERRTRHRLTPGHQDLLQVRQVKAAVGWLLPAQRQSEPRQP